MSWPTPQDYNEALQNPRLNFEDADLLAGTPELTALGLPRPITGGFASVYSVRSGSRRWAVRCFLRDFPDHQERYAEIARHLAAARLPYTVDFHFLEKGIRVRGSWHPVLKMEWIEGSTFQDTIEANIQNPIALANLADRWLKMLAALKKNGIAHGDLQHGNVLIAGGDFRLIDYDGMFVPPLAGKPSHEIGHRNYQHPGRTESDFGPHLDNFSGWVVYLSLIACSVDPSLWGRFGRGEEHLLFRKEDFEAPRYSRLFRSLLHVKDDRIQKYLPLLQSYLGMGLSSIACPADVVGTTARKRDTRHVPLPSWSRESQLDLFISKRKPDVPATAFESDGALAVAVAEEPCPVVDTVDAVQFSQPVGRERVLLASYAVFMVALIGFVAHGTVAGIDAVFLVLAGLSCAVVSLTCSYLSLDEVHRKFVVWSAVEFHRNRCDVVQFGVDRIGDWISRNQLKESQKIRRLSARDVEHGLQEKDRIAVVKRTLASWIDELDARRKELDRAEKDEVSQLSCARGEHRLLLRDLPGIRARYDLERSAIHRSEIFSRNQTRNKILKIRRIRERRHQRLEGNRAAIHRRFEKRRERLHRIINDGTDWLRANRLVLARDLSEMDRYRDVRFKKYMQRILGVTNAG